MAFGAFAIIGLIGSLHADTFFSTLLTQVRDYKAYQGKLSNRQRNSSVNQYNSYEINHKFHM
jgi:hypothetical protein